MPVKGRNSFGIPYLRTGIPALDQVIWKVLDALDQLRIQPGTSASGMTGPGGTIVNAKGGAFSPVRQGLLPFAPFEVSDAGQLRVSFVPGFANGEPPMIGGVSLLDIPAPYLVITVSAGFFLKATVDAMSDITAWEIIASASTPTSSFTPGTGGVAHFRIGGVTVISGQITAFTHIARQNLLLGVGAGYLWTGC